MVSIRHWLPDDRQDVVPLILLYLIETEPDGYDYAPTLRNAEFLFGLGLAHSMNREPVVLAELDNKVVGWTCWIPPISYAIQFKEHTCIGMGTFVIVSARRIGVAKLLHSRAADIARGRGYHSVDRIGTKGKGIKMLERDGWKPIATVYRRAL